MKNKFTVIQGGKSQLHTPRPTDEQAMGAISDDGGLKGFFGDLAEHQPLELDELSPEARMEIEYMLLSDPKEDQFDFRHLGLA